MLVVAWNNSQVEVTQDSLSPSPVVAFTDVEWQAYLDAQDAGEFPNATLALQIAHDGSGWELFHKDVPAVTVPVPRYPDMVTFIQQTEAGEYALAVLQG